MMKRTYLCVNVAALSFAGLAQADTVDMHPVTVNGYQIDDAEYLPFVGTQTLRYPDDVLWGFNPAGANAQAKQCALAAYRGLLDFFHSDSSILHDAVTLGATPHFILWINDYSRSGQRPIYLGSRLWHPGSPGLDFTQGFWSWEVTLTPAGECLQPDPLQVQQALATARAALNGKL